MQQIVHTARLGSLFTRPGDGHGLLGRVDVELQVQHAVLERPRDLVARVTEHPHHLAVLGKHLGDEPSQPTLPRRGGQMLQQDRAQPPALVGILHHEGDLSRVALVEPVEPADRDDVVTQHRHERHPVDVVDGAEPHHVTLGHPRIRPEVPEVPGALAQPAVEGKQLVGVLRG